MSSTHPLRERAEDTLARGANESPRFSDPRELVHELQVHQIELEMQNDELRAAQRDADTSRERYRDLFDHAPVGYVVSGPRGIAQVNRTFADIVGAPPEALADASLVGFVLPADRDAFKQHEGAVLASGRRQTTGLRLVTREGELREVRLESVRTSAAAKQWRTAVLDVTEERRLERQLAGAAPPDESAVVHDFGNVLMSVIGQADRALARLLPEHPARGPLDTLKQLAADGAMLVTRLLEEIRPATTAPASSDIDRDVGGVEPSLRRLCGASITLKVSLGANGAHVSLSAAQLEQILVNLVSNARDAMPGGGGIMIETSRAGDRDAVVLTVSDTGPGMDLEVQLHAFEPYFTTRAGRGGTGIGLSIVYRLVKGAGGQLHLLSTPAAGTSFRMVLPRADAPASSHAPRAPTSQLTILLVEDDEILRRAVRRTLQVSGYAVLEVGSAEQALALLPAHLDVDLLLSDVELPGMNGPDLVREVRSLVPRVRVVMMSGMPVASIELPEAVRFVPKPFESPKLLQQIHASLVEHAGEIPTVLVVEDDARTLVAYQELLWSEGFRMLAARSVAQAQDVFQRNHSDIAAVLADFRLPDGSGVQLASELRSARPELPVVYVSAERGNPDLDAACKAPGVELVRKPVEITKLATAIRRVIARSRDTELAGWPPALA